VPLAPFALLSLAELQTELQLSLPVIASMVAWTAFMVYVLAYLSRRIEANKAVLGAETELEHPRVWGARYFDVGTLDLVRRLLSWFWIAIFLYVLLAIASFRWAEARVFLIQVNLRFSAGLFVALTWVIVAVLLRIMRRFGAYHRGELRAKPHRIAQPRLLGVATGVLKYVGVAAAILISFVGAGSILPAGVPEKPILESVGTSLTAPSEGLLKARSRFKATSLGKLQNDGTIAPPYGKKIYSWTHIVMNLGRLTERQIVAAMIVIQAVFAVIPFLNLV